MCLSSLAKALIPWNGGKVNLTGSVHVAELSFEFVLVLGFFFLFPTWHGADAICKAELWTQSPF